MSYEVYMEAVDLEELEKEGLESDYHFYPDSYAHIEDELRKLELLLRLRVKAYQMQVHALKQATVSQTMYISHEEVNSLLGEDNTFLINNDELQNLKQDYEILKEKIKAKVSESQKRGVLLYLAQLAELFDLSPFEYDIVIICLAPELRRKYDRIYAYLQEDITRHKPSVDLVLSILCDTEKERWKARGLFSPHYPLFRNHIVQMSDDPQSPSGRSDLAHFLKLAPRIVSYIVGENGIDETLTGCAQLTGPYPVNERPLVWDRETQKQLVHLMSQYLEHSNRTKQLIVYLYGSSGAGKRALAGHICSTFNRPVLYLDGDMLFFHDSDVQESIQKALRECVLQNAVLYIDNCDHIFKDQEREKAFIKKLLAGDCPYSNIIFAAGSRRVYQGTLAGRGLFHVIEIANPSPMQRETIWKEEMKGLNRDIDPAWAYHFSDKFQLTAGQIRGACEYVRLRQMMNNNCGSAGLGDFYEACRGQSNHKLSDLSVKIEPLYGWDDIVVPQDTMEKLKEICGHVRHRNQVLNHWGFAQKLSRGKGVSALFSGPPGTGKTMAAEVIARELHLDLYKIDLSGVVSKYIGETEKNLSRIFHEAETSNAIIFFDEADALFGKRTDVSDAHDRYANIEISYLLQKMEEYDGVVILATNLRQNMDDAFTRRLGFIIEFPFPDEKNRLKIWQNHFPKETPQSNDIDYEFLAKKIQVSGGNIKNIVLNAAFLAVQDDNAVSMKHILKSTKREFEKIGKIWNQTY